MSQIQPLSLSVHEEPWKGSSIPVLTTKIDSADETPLNQLPCLKFWRFIVTVIFKAEVHST